MPVKSEMIYSKNSEDDSFVPRCAGNRPDGCAASKADNGFSGFHPNPEKASMMFSETEMDALSDQSSRDKDVFHDEPFAIRSPFHFVTAALQDR